MTEVTEETKETQGKPGRRLLFLDCEATGLVNKEAELAEWHKQPHITQVAALLVDEQTRKDMSVFSTLIRPLGKKSDFTIPEEITEKTGITREACLRYGLLMVDALDHLSNLADRADAWGAFNRRFDGQMLRIESVRNVVPYYFEAFDKDSKFCVMRLAAKAMGKGAYVKCGVAYEHFFGKVLEGAHGRLPLADVTAAKDIYFAVKDEEDGAASAAEATV